MPSISAFAEAVNTVRSRYSILTVTALFMAVGVFVYYFYFLTSREEVLDQRQLRALNRIESTLNVNMQGYKSLAMAQANAAIRETMEQLKLDGISYNSPIGDYREKFMNELRNVSFIKAPPKGGLQLNLLDTVYATNLAQDIAFVSQFPEYDSLIYISVYSPLKNYGVEQDIAVWMEFTIPFGAVFRPLLRNDLFDQYFVVKDSQIVYATVASGLTRLDYDTIDTDKSKSYAIRMLNINGTRYRAYPAGITLNAQPGWSIIGLVSATDFATEKRTIPRQYLFIVFLAIVFLVLSVPFMKSLIMSRSESLGSKDLIFSAISLALTISVVVILMLDGYMRTDLDNPEREKQLVELASQIENNLRDETIKYVQVLNEYGDYIDTHADKLDPNDSGKTRKQLIGQVVDGFNMESHPAIHNMFFVDRAGFTMFDRFDPGFKFKLKSRPYVYEILNGNCIHDDSSSLVYYLDAIISWREQCFRGVISVPTPAELDISKDYPVIALTAEMQSITHPILPKGAGFAIFNSNGNVLFHSDSLRRLNENIFEECNDDPTLKAVVAGRTKKSISLDYSGTPTTIFVRPLNGMPYYIATFISDGRTDAMHGQVFGFAFILQILLLVWLMLIILFSVVIIRRRTRLHIPLFTLSGFVPEEKDKDLYLRAVLFNFIHGMLLFIAAGFMDEPLTVIAMFFIATPHTVALNLALLSKEKLKNCFSGEKKLIFRTCLIIIVMANIVTVWISDMLLVLIAIQLLVLGVYLLLESGSRREKSRMRFTDWLNSVNYRTVYAWQIYMLVILLSVVPALRFSIIAYNKEKEIEVKTAQLTMYQKMDGTVQAVQPYSQYQGAFFATRFNNDPKKCEASGTPDLYFDAFSSFMRANIQNSGELYNRLRFGAEDGLWGWCYSASDSLLMTTNPNDCHDAKALSFVSKVGVFRVPFFAKDTVAHTLRFWFLSISGLVLLFYVLKTFLGKLFALEKYSRNRILKFDEAFFRNTEPGYKAFVTGMPSAGKSAYFFRMCSGIKNVTTFDFVSDAREEWSGKLKKCLEPGKGLIVLDHFEHDLLNPALTLEKLRIVEQIIAVKDKKVIIISSVQPLMFMRMLEGQEHVKKNKDEYSQLLERWNRALAAFYDFVFPLQGYNDDQPKLISIFSERLQENEKAAIPQMLIDLIEDECKHGLFMRSIGIEMLAELHSRDDIRIHMKSSDKWKETEDIIIRIQKLADNYYRSVWKNLTTVERFVLYDLAQDGLVNPKNLDIVESLIDRGLIFYKHQLEVMNQSFRNFVLCVVGPTDIGQMEEQMKHTGAWSNLRLPLLLIVCALLLFVVKSDRSALFGYFTAFTAIIPLVVSLFGIFSKPFVKKE